MAIQLTSIYVPGIYRGGDKADDVRRYVEDELAQISRFLGEATDLDLRPLFYSDAAGATGVSVLSYHDSPSPAASDVILAINATGNNNAGEQVTYAQLSARIDNTVNGSERGYLAGQVMLDGTLSDTLMGVETFLFGKRNGSFFEYVLRSPLGYRGDLYLESQDNGATGTELILWHNSSSPASSDTLGSVSFDGRDSSAAYQRYSSIYARITTATAGSEEGTLIFQNTQSSGNDLFYLYNGLVVGAPTGANKGIGTVNCGSAYDDGTILITCYPLEMAATGRIDVARWDNLVPNLVLKAEPRVVIPADPMRGRPEKIIEAKPERTIVNLHEPIRKFMSRLGTEYDPMTLSGQRKHVIDKKHLTPYQNPENFSEETRPSLGGLLQCGVEMDELLFIYVCQQADAIAALEARVAALEAP